MLTLSLSALSSTTIEHLLLPTICLVFHLCLAYSLDPETTKKMIVPISKVYCFGKERKNEKTTCFVNFLLGEAWTIGIVNLILRDKANDVLPESFVLCQKNAALVVFLSSTFFTVFFTCAARYRQRNEKIKIINTAATIYFVTLSAYILQVTSLSLLQCVIATALTIWIFGGKNRETRFSPVLFLTPAIFMAGTTIVAGLIVCFDSSAKGVFIATSFTFLAILLQIREDLPPWFLPSKSKHSRQDVMKNKADKSGVPLSYYDAGGSERVSEEMAKVVQVGETRMSIWQGLKAMCLITLAGFAGRGETLSVPILVLHSMGFDLPGTLEAVSGDLRFIVLYCALSAMGAAYSYHDHCTRIEKWKSMRSKDSVMEWKCQPNKTASPESIELSRRLGTFNAGLAAVLGMATTLLHLHDANHTYLYFDISEYGLMWFIVSFVIFFCWIEAFAYVCMMLELDSLSLSHTHTYTPSGTRFIDSFI